MEKDQFLALIKNYTSLDNEDLRVLISAQKLYPYSQAIHNLASRAAADNESPLREELLHISAIYTTERAVLKSIMTEPKKAWVEIKPARTFAHHIEAPVAEEVYTYSTAQSIADDQHFLDSVFSDLENLRKSKLIYEASMDALDKEKERQLIHSLKVSDPELEIDNSVLQEHTLVEDIKNTKEEISVVAPKQQEQIEIIENFIKTQPGLPRAKPETESIIPTDLTEKSQHFADNVISETLVEILLKQGKKAKAIEVLKKLIWKFPQKKAYFAAQIEDLKK